MDEYGRVAVPSDAASVWMSEMELVELLMVVALAFHINTPNAARVRNALLERMCLRKDRQMLWLSLSDRQPCKC